MSDSHLAWTRAGMAVFGTFMARDARAALPVQG
jgi:hypothetical protein